MKNTLIIFLVLILAACSSNSARIENEIVSRPAVEQRALTSAMENAFSDISFGTFKDIKTHVEVQGLSDRDLVFVKGYIENRILSVGGGVTRNIDDATYRVNLVLNVIGGDRVGTNYYIFSTERVIGEFSGRFTVIDDKSNVLMSTMLSSSKSEKLRWGVRESFIKEPNPNF